MFSGYPCTRLSAEKHREGHQGEAAVFPGEGLQRRAGRPDGERQREWHRAHHAGTKGNTSTRIKSPRVEGKKKKKVGGENPDAQEATQSHAGVLTHTALIEL